jgi:hypothetical protein
MTPRWSHVLAGLVSSLVLVASPLAAQEQTGSIEGTVQDVNGGVLPGATVEAHHRQVGSTMTVTTDGHGEFRLASLTPGDYEVVASLDGFAPGGFERVELLLGQIKRLEFRLAPAGVTEAVEVRPTSPLVDVKQSARGASLRQEQIELLPRGVDYTSLTPMLPGANIEPRLGGLSIDGSSASENRFVIDGVDTTDVITGVAGLPLSVDTVAELQIKSSGYAAEYGGSTGGVVNVITKAGTNTWSGDVRLYFSGDGLTGDARPVLRRNLQDSSQAEYGTYPKDTFTSFEPGFSLGGPIARDHAWFFVAYQPVLLDTERPVTFALDGSSGTYEQKVRRHLLTASQTAQIGAKLRTRLALSMGTIRTDGVLPSQAGTDTPVGHFDIVTTEPRWMGSAGADYLVSPRLLLTGRLAYYYANRHTDNVSSDPRYLFATSNIGYLDVPTELQRVTGFASDTSLADTVRDRRTRLSALTDVTWYFRGLGQHELKAGVQADWTGNDIDEGAKANTVALAWNRSLLGQRGQYGVYVLGSNSRDPRRGRIQFGMANGTTAGLFVQDSWTFGPHLTLNVGLRTERETVPQYSDDGEASPIIEFGFGDKIAPRVGAAWDLRGDGRWKVYGSWGVFYDIFKYEMSTAFGSIDTQQYAFTLDTYDWPNLLSDPGCPPACPGRKIFGPLSGANTSTDAIDPALEPMRLQEATVGIEHQLGSNVSVAARYVHKQLDRAVEDIGSRDEDYNEIYTIGNPGFGRATIAYAGVALPKAVRDYDAVELAVRRIMSHGWSLDASYTWSRLHGNYSGLSQSDEDGRTSPNVGRLYDYPITLFGEDGRPVLGPLATDRPHQLKLHGVWSSSFGLSAGLLQLVATGVPITREAAVLPPNNYPAQYLGRLSDGRTPALSQTDVYLQQDLRWGKRYRLSLAVSVTNLLDQNTVISKFETETEQGSGLQLDEGAYYAGQVDIESLFDLQQVARDPRFLMADAFQAPRTIRLMLRWSF